MLFGYSVTSANANYRVFKQKQSIRETTPLHCCKT